MHKQHEEFAATPQCCGVGVVLEHSCSSSTDSSLPAHPLETRRGSLVHASWSCGHASSSSQSLGSPPSHSSELNSSCDVRYDEFVVRDLLEGFSGATSCALQRGDRVLSINGVDVSGKTESAAGTVLFGVDAVLFGVDAVLFSCRSLTLFVAWRQHSFHDARASRQHGAPSMYARNCGETLRRSIAKGKVGA